MPKTYDSLIRVSKMGSRVVSADSTMTIDDQRDANEHAVSEAGGLVGKELLAIDESGYSVTESPQWREALGRCERGDSAGIVVAYGDRLTRNWRGVGAYYDALEKAGAEVLIGNMPGVDFRTPEGRVSTGMLAIMGDMQYQAAKVRGERIADRTIARGVPNRVPYGYRRNAVNGVKVDPDRDAKALVPNPETAPWVKLVFELRADAWSWGRIADELAARGARGPAGGAFVPSTLSWMIGNRVYLGTVTLGKRTVERAHEPIVDTMVWTAAQRPPRSPQHRDGRFAAGLAGGLLTCSTCGGGMSIVAGQARGGGERFSYACRGRNAAGRCSRPVAITKEKIDRWLDEWVVDGIEGQEPFDVFITARELESARRAVALAVERRQRIVVTAAEWEPEDAKAAYDAAKAAELGARAHYDHLAARASELDDLPDSADAWHALSLDGQRRVLRLLVDRIEVAPPVSRSKFASMAARLKLVERDGGE